MLPRVHLTQKGSVKHISELGEVEGVPWALSHRPYRAAVETDFLFKLADHGQTTLNLPSHSSLLILTCVTWAILKDFL